MHQIKKMSLTVFVLITLQPTGNSFANELYEFKHELPDLSTSAINKLKSNQNLSLTITNYSTTQSSTPTRLDALIQKITKGVNPAPFWYCGVYLPAPQNITSEFQVEAVRSFDIWVPLHGVTKKRYYQIDLAQDKQYVGPIDFRMPDYQY